MPVDWTEFEAVEPPTTDWTDFEPVEEEPTPKPAPLNTAQYVAGGGPMAGMALIPSPAESPTAPFVPLPRITIPGELGNLKANLLQGIVAPYNVAAGLIEGAESPVGVGTMALGPIGKVGQAVIGAGFGVPAVVEGAKQVYRGAALGEPQQTLEGALQVGAGGAMTAGGIRTLEIPQNVPRGTEPITLPKAPPFTGEAREFQLLRENWLPTIKPWRRGLLDEEVAKGTGTDNIETNFQDSPGARDVTRAKRYYELARKLFGRTGEEVAPTEPTPKLPREEVPPSGEAGEAKPSEAPVSAAVETPVTAGETPQAIAEPKPPEPPKQEVSVTPPVTEGEKPIGMGGAEASEIPVTGAGGEKYGIAQRVREERAQAGQVEPPVQPGEGINTPDSIARGREIIRTDPAAPENMLSEFEKDPQKRVSSDLIAATRAHGEALAAGARNIEEQFGTESPQYKESKDALSSWDKRTKPIQTEWHKQGMAQQGETDIDTGSFTGLERAYRDSTGNDLSPARKPRAKKIAADNKKAQDTESEAANALNTRIREKNPVDAEKAAIDVANKTVREAAVKLADAENKARVAQAQRDKEIANIQVKNAQKALKAAQDVERKVRERAIKEAQRRANDPSIAVWELANKYLEENKGLYSFDDIRNKIATDLGISVNKVTSIMAQDSKTKHLANDLWIKQQNTRRLKESAKIWLREMDTPGYQKALLTIPRAMFSLKVGLHGTVALGTHAPMVAFQPRFWNAYVRNFGKMYGMVFSPTYYERKIQDLVRSPNYITARRAGLQNDPFKYEEYHTSEIRDLVSKWIGAENMSKVDKMSSAGNRGYTVLKTIRQDMFDEMWNQLPKTTKIPEVAEAIANGINHATGVVKGRAPAGSNLALFAPRLMASRVMWLAADPLKMADTFSHWKTATPGEKQFAMNQVKEKAWVFGTLASMLALNQGFLSAAGSDQQINVTDPLRSDFLKFKAAGMDVAYGSAMLNMAKLPLRMAVAILFEGKSSKLIMEDERAYNVALSYIRTQLSPFAGTTADLAFGRDYQERPLPKKMFGLVDQEGIVPKRLREQGIEPYTWGEYSSTQFTPIPISEGIREVWKGMGMPEEQMEDNIKALAITSIMAATGGRITEDTRRGE